MVRGTGCGEATALAIRQESRVTDQERNNANVVTFRDPMSNE